MILECSGLAFKPDTDDVRESASRKIITDLLQNGAKVIVHDPIAIENASKSWPEMRQVVCLIDWEKNISSVDIIIIATKWPDYLALKTQASFGILKGKTIMDPRRLFKSTDFPDSQYLSIGYSR